MRTKRAETHDGSSGSTLKRILTLLGFTFLAGYLLGRRRAERGWEAEDWAEGTTVEIDGEEVPVPGESLVGEESEPGEEVPDAGQVRETPEPDEDETGGGDAEEEEAGNDETETGSADEEEDDEG